MSRTVFPEVFYEIPTLDDVVIEDYPDPEGYVESNRELDYDDYERNSSDYDDYDMYEPEVYDFG